MFTAINYATNYIANYSKKCINSLVLSECHLSFKSNDASCLYVHGWSTVINVTHQCCVTCLNTESTQIVNTWCQKYQTNWFKQKYHQIINGENILKKKEDVKFVFTENCQEYNTHIEFSVDFFFLYYINEWFQYLCNGVLRMRWISLKGKDAIKTFYFSESMEVNPATEHNYFCLQKSCHIHTSTIDHNWNYHIKYWKMWFH